MPNDVRARPQDSCGQAIAFHRKGNLAEAERIYLSILAADPRHFDCLHLLGAIRLQQGRPAEALDLFTRALRQNPLSAAALLNSGNALRDLGRGAEALAQYDRALALEPDNVTVLYNRGNLLRDLKQYDAALESFERALAWAPGDAELRNNYGSLLQHLRRFDDARLNFEKVLALDPGYAKALTNLGLTLLASGHTADGLRAFAKHGAAAANTVPGIAPDYKERHDRERQDYLAGARAAGVPAEDGGRLCGPALAALDAARLAEEWRRGRPQLLVLDDFLTPDALAKLRRFCWDADVWRKCYNEGYLGALLEHGFACPLLGQIADELRAALPAILGQHPLIYLWGFKYDSSLSGVKLHADSAAVNVNFWITPDDANLDPQSGGLIVWDAAAPLDWEFNAFNNDETAARAFLQKAGAKATTIPYRANRAVIFDSDLFHETDRIRFRPGYRNRRINVTLLYGWRK